MQLPTVHERRNNSMQDKYTTFKRKRTVRQVAFLVAVAIAAVIIGTVHAGNLRAAAEARTITAWILCQPNDYVNVRMNPSKRSTVVGYAEAGDEILVSDMEKNGFVCCYSIGESSCGWIHKGYVVYEKPVKVDITATVASNKRLAARKYIGGKTRKWLKNQDEVTVYWMTDEWCVTNKGFVMTKYLEVYE